jgi:hypothetical protein
VAAKTKKETLVYISLPRLDNEPARLGSLKARDGSLGSRASYKKYIKFNICIYQKLKNSNNTKIIYPIALN